MANPNLQLLVDAAKLLKPILGELVFVGGCTTALLITDKAAADVRPTYDVDAIAEITSYVGYAEFSKRLKALGFHEDTREGEPRADNHCHGEAKRNRLAFIKLPRGSVSGVYFVFGEFAHLRQSCDSKNQ